MSQPAPKKPTRGEVARDLYNATPPEKRWGNVELIKAMNPRRILKKNRPPKQPRRYKKATPE